MFKFVFFFLKFENGQMYTFVDKCVNKSINVYVIFMYSLTNFSSYVLSLLIQAAQN